jgi:pyruvate/2-oxoacid:ferredoxin oxidoreductase beta subunit
MAVHTRVFPLLEVEDGTTWRFTADHPGDPVAPYLQRDGRFRRLTEEQVERIQATVDARWKALEHRVANGT